MSNQLLTSPPQPSAAEWAQIVEQSNETQLSLRAFSAQIGVPLQQLYNWRSRLKTSTPTPRLSRGFKEVKPTFAVTPNSMREEGAIEVHLRNGRMVRVTVAMIRIGGHFSYAMAYTGVQHDTNEKNIFQGIQS